MALTGDMKINFFMTNRKHLIQNVGEKSCNYSAQFFPALRFDTAFHLAVAVVLECGGLPPL